MCLLQLFITFGILAAQLINYGTQFVPYGWHISLGLAGLPALLLILGSLMVPDTPNSLVDRGYVEEARATLIKIRGTDSKSPAPLLAQLLVLCCKLIVLHCAAQLPHGNITTTIHRSQLLCCVLASVLV